MIQIRITEDALSDLSAGYSFYEAQQEGLGDYFLGCLRSDIDALKIFAGIHRIVHRDYHRLLSKTFPYSVYYTFTGDSVTVWAVIDCRRDPDWIRNRLGQ